MKKISVGIICLFSSIICFAQNFDAIRKDFEQKMDSTIYGKNEAVGKYYDIRGFKMYYEIYGQGEPLLIIHGNGGSINNFLLQIPFFSKKYKVIIADSRAQGKSVDKADSLSYEMMADDYAELLTTLKIDSANVIGWSDGGINGLLLAIRHPEKVKKLAVTGANLRPDTTAVHPEILNMFMPGYKAMKTKKATFNQEQKDSYKLMNLLMDEPHIPLTDLHKIAAPTLVICGDNEVIKVEHSVEIYRNIAKSYLWILPNSGHSTPVVYADEFNQTVDRFFSYPYRKIKGNARFF